jgi:hypothetical protein
VGAERNRDPSSLDELLERTTTKKCTFEELLSFVRSFASVSASGTSPKVGKYKAAWNAVDSAMERQLTRGETVDVDSVARAVLAWQALGLCRISKFCRSSVDFLASRTNELSDETFLVLLFAVVATRRWPSLHADVVEARVRDLAARTSRGSDLGLVSAAFFKSKTKCADFRVVDDVVARSVDLLTSGYRIDDVSLCSVAKFAAYMSRTGWATGAAATHELSRAILPFSTRTSLQAVVHVYEACSRHRTAADELFAVVYDRILLEECRLKELERFLLAWDQVGPDVSFEDGEKLAYKLRKVSDEERRKYVHSFQVCVRTLVANRAPVDDGFVRFCLQEDSVRALIGEFEVLVRAKCFISIQFQNSCKLSPSTWLIRSEVVEH